MIRMETDYGLDKTNRQKLNKLTRGRDRFGISPSPTLSVVRGGPEN